MKRLLFLLAAVGCLIALEFLRRKMDEHDDHLLFDLREGGMAVPEDEYAEWFMFAEAPYGIVVPARKGR